LEYEPNKESIKKHEVPDWFHDAKFGIFIHWGLYSIPAFAPTGRGDLIEIIKKEGWKGQFTNNPYAEWHLNTIKIENSPAQKYHREKFGEDFSYDQFAPIFNEKIKGWDPDEMAEIFKKSGARYVVLGTKHHDGFLLWPSSYKNPVKENWHSKRDIVGELTEAVRSRGMKMGFYYSGGLDWSFTPHKKVLHVVDFLTNGPTSKEYAEYVKNHYYELIEKYKPSILWNDIGYPPKGDIFELFAHFYNTTKDGVVNDRWNKIPKFIRPIMKFWPIKKLISWVAKKMMSDGEVGLEPKHYDFLTPEYTQASKILKKKWESTRGIGNSFGYNKFEGNDDYLSIDELIRLLVDIVSKNGNLLLNVGPKADGSIVDLQKERILGIGAWLEINGDAIYDTRPWITAEGITIDDIPIRYTSKNEKLFAMVLENPQGDIISIKNINPSENTEIRLLGYDDKLEWERSGEDLMIYLPKNLEKSPVHVLSISPIPELIISDEIE
jgi:alpha-L-fucosidase